MSPEASRIKQDLLAAAEAAVGGQPASVGTQAAAGKPRSRLILGSLALAALLGSYVSILQPDWVFVSAPVEELPEIAEASLRLSLVRERQRVETYLREHGSLPATLAAAGGSLPGARLVPGDALGFAIVAPLGDGLLELRSTDTLELFLGNSLQVILSRSEAQ